MERYAVFLDIDNTLYWHGDIPERNIRAIEAAQARGHLFFINTGRGYAHLPAAVREKVHMDGYVCALGSYVRVGDTELVNALLPYEAWHRVAEMLFETGIVGRLQGPEKIYHLIRADEPDGICIRSMEELDRDKNFRCSKVTFSQPIPEWCEEELKPYMNFVHLPTYSEAGAKGCTKATGMDAVLRYFDIPIERCVAMGDSANDLEMLSHAGISVVMGDGEECVKKLCTHVTCDCKDGGVGEFVENFLLK